MRRDKRLFLLNDSKSKIARIEAIEIVREAKKSLLRKKKNVNVAVAPNANLRFKSFLNLTRTPFNH